MSGHRMSNPPNYSAMFINLQCLTPQIFFFIQIFFWQIQVLYFSSVIPNLLSIILKCNLTSYILHFIFHNLFSLAPHLEVLLLSSLLKIQWASSQSSQKDNNDRKTEKWKWAKMLICLSVRSLSSLIVTNWLTASRHEICQKKLHVGILGPKILHTKKALIAIFC